MAIPNTTSLDPGSYTVYSNSGYWSGSNVHVSAPFFFIRRNPVDIQNIPLSLFIRVFIRFHQQYGVSKDDCVSLGLGFQNKKETNVLVWDKWSLRWFNKNNGGSFFLPTLAGKGNKMKRIPTTKSCFCPLTALIRGVFFVEKSRYVNSPGRCFRWICLLSTERALEIWIDCSWRLLIILVVNHRRRHEYACWISQSTPYVVVYILDLFFYFPDHECSRDWGLQQSGYKKGSVLVIAAHKDCHLKALANW